MTRYLILAALLALLVWPIAPLARFYGPFIAAYLLDNDPARP